jgi:hypothetical protein
MQHRQGASMGMESSTAYAHVNGVESLDKIGQDDNRTLDRPIALCVGTSGHRFSMPLWGAGK